jgi:xylulokinase
MYIGIDLGTSGVKALLLSEQQQVLASHTIPLKVSRPQLMWSEQNPEQWWQATDLAIQALAAQYSISEVQAIGLSGQMHGATLLGRQHQVLRPAILWNDGRSHAECQALEKKVPEARCITGNIFMPGFTAPKLLWIQRNEPNLFTQIDKVLLPKDYLRWRMTGNFFSDMSDAAGTLWLDIGKREWSDVLLAACGMERRQMPALVEGNNITGQLRSELAARWGLPSRTVVVGGGGDNAAGAIGVGVYRQGQAMLSLGTSGVYFAVSNGFLSNPDQGVHSFCHALPKTWHLMSVMLSAASCLDWAAEVTGLHDVPTLLKAASSVVNSKKPPLYFLPYLSGERTPHNNVNATGAFWGLTHSHNSADLARAVLEGVSFGLADGMAALHATGLQPDSVTLIGGGARSPYWRQLLADITGTVLDYRSGGDVGPALGAARLAALACNPHSSLESMLPLLPLETRYKPDNAAHESYQKDLKVFRQLYQQLKTLRT